MTASSKESTQYVACDHCAMEPICQPINVADQSLLLSDNYLDKRIETSAQEVLFNQDEALSSIYAVCSGCFKLVVFNSKNEEKIIGFRFPGELLGEDALFPKKYGHQAIAIENSTVCKVSVQELTSNANLVPDLQANLVNLLSRQSYINQKEFNSLVAKKSAESLLASFLLNISERYRFYSGTKHLISLSMSRENIANFLGLRRETLSRLLSKFQKDGILILKGKKIELLALEKLSFIAEH
jgi:CRP/FNR family transcriptional regulator, anaerobic regulatory protein